MTNNKSIFSQNMKKARALKNWSQEGAATASGLSRKALAKYEEGLRMPSYGNQIKIRKTYDIINWDAFISDPDYFKQKLTAEELEKKYQELQEPAKTAVNVLLGIQ